MLNAVGRDIPEEILKVTGKEVFQGVHHFDGHVYKKHGPETKCVINSEGSKLVENIHEVLVKCGIKDITICASSLGKAHDELVSMIEDGTITNIQSSGVRGKIGEAISHGKLKGLAIMRSHGGRVRALATGETQIDKANRFFYSRKVFLSDIYKYSARAHVVRRTMALHRSERSEDAL